MAHLKQVKRSTIEGPKVAWLLVRDGEFACDVLPGFERRGWHAKFGSDARPQGLNQHRVVGVAKKAMEYLGCPVWA